MKSTENINKDLLIEQKLWVKKILLPWVESSNSYEIAAYAKSGTALQRLSHPFYFSLPDEYVDTDKIRVMLVGQTARGYGALFDGTANYENLDDAGSTNSLNNSAKWTVCFWKKRLGLEPCEYPQVYGEESFNLKRDSLFWKFLKSLNCDRTVCCWNNLDKVHYNNVRSDKKGNILPETLSLSGEQALCNAYFCGKTLLQREIQLAEPKFAVFATGPCYYESMAAALQIDKDKLSNFKPTKKETVADITDLAKLEGTRVLWTYHPSFLNRINKFNETAEKIMSLITA